jgi:hypothetical protein
MAKLQQTTTRVSKRHVQNTMTGVMLNRKRLFLVKMGALKDVEGIGYDVERCWGRQDVRSIPLVVENYFLFFSF